MIRIKTIVEITDEFNREDLDLDFQKMSLKDLQNYCLSNSSERENEIKDAICANSKVHIKSVEVTEKWVNRLTHITCN